jgi:hypothetical protein
MKRVHTPPKPSPEPISAYVKTHCTICAAGWTRRNAEGQMAVICLLDRLPAWDLMVDCDRFEPRQSSGPPRD